MTSGNVPLSACPPQYNSQCACLLTLVNNAVKVCNVQFIGALGMSNHEPCSGIHNLCVTNKQKKSLKRLK